MATLLVFGLVGLAGVLWVLMERHERRRAAAGLPRLSALRLVFAAAAMLTLLFSGGCGLLFLANQDSQYVTGEAVAVIAGPPLAFGAALAWLMLNRSESRVALAVSLGLVLVTAVGWNFLWLFLLYGDYRPLTSALMGLLVTGLCGVVWLSGAAKTSA